MIFWQSDIPGASLDTVEGYWPMRPTYRPRFDASRLFLRSIMHSVYKPRKSKLMLGASVA